MESRKQHIKHELEAEGTPKMMVQENPKMIPVKQAIQQSV